MIIGIHQDKIGEESYSEKWTYFLKSNGVKVINLNLLSQDAIQIASLCDGIMWRWAHNQDDKQSAKRILYTIEKYLDIPVFPESKTSWHYDEKISQLYLLQAIGAPIPETLIFWNMNEALEWAMQASYPYVFKLSVGAGSSNVVKVEAEAEAIALIKRSFNNGIFPMRLEDNGKKNIFPKSMSEIKGLLKRSKSALRFFLLAEYPALPHHWWKPEFGYAYFQEYIPDNKFDTRITVIGKRAFGFRRFNRAGDFRASGSGVIDYEPEEIDPRLVEIAFNISERCGFQSMAYDFLIKNDEPMLCEISYAFADWAVNNCPGHWLPNLEWKSGHMWPEEAQVSDFILSIEKKNS